MTAEESTATFYIFGGERLHYYGGSGGSRRRKRRERRKRSKRYTSCASSPCMR